MTPRQRHGALVVGYALVTMIFAFMTWAAFSRMRESFVNADVVAGSVAWPTWVASLSVTLGFATIWLRVAHCLCRARTVGDHRYLADRTAAPLRHSGGGLMLPLLIVAGLIALLALGTPVGFSLPPPSALPSRP